MSTENNKALIRRLFEATTVGNIDALDELVVPEAVTHGDAVFPVVQGREAMKNGIKAFRTAFPDATLTVDKMFAEADKVVTHVIVRGTQQGDWLGAAPTGRTMIWTASSIARFANGKMVESWVIQDELGIMQQLGLVPSPGQ